MIQQPRVHISFCPLIENLFRFWFLEFLKTNKIKDVSFQNFKVKIEFEVQTSMISVLFIYNVCRFVDHKYLYAWNIQYDIETMIVLYFITDNGFSIKYNFYN